VNTLYLGVFTYGRGIAGRQIPGQPASDHGNISTISIFTAEISPPLILSTTRTRVLKNTAGTLTGSRNQLLDCCSASSLRYVASCSITALR
jgi:hypothetical protein